MRSFRLHLTVILGYLVLALLFTLPLVANFASAIPGDGFDGLQNYWNLWWVRRALLDLYTSPFFTQELYYPTGASLLFHTLNIFNGLWSLPIQALSNLAVTYNTVVLFTFIMSGYGVFLLAVEVLAAGRRVRLHSPYPAAFLAGFIFAFAPVRLAQLLGHMQVFSTEWLPFFALVFLRLYRLGLTPRRVVLAALFLVLNALCDWYFVLYLLIFAALIALWTMARRPLVRGLRSAFVPLAAVLACAGLMLSPLLLPMVTEAASAAYLRPPFEETVLLSADLVAFFTPSVFHPLWGEAAGAVAQRFTSSTSERTVFAGLVPLALAALGIWRARRGEGRHGSVSRLGSPAFWLATMLLFFVLALGPYLHVLGQVVAPVPLPYAWLYALLPLVRIARSVSRFDIMVMLALAVLASLGLMTLRPRTRVACGLLIALEFLAVPYPLSPIQVPSFYARLRDEPGSFAVLELPISFDRPDPLLDQTVHARPLITAYTSRSNPLSLVERTPLLDELRTLQPDIIRYDARAIASSVLSDLGVRYVINHPLTMGAGDERTVTNRVLQEMFGGQPPVVDEPNLVAYRVPAPQPYRPYLSLGAGWSDVAWVSGKPQRLVEQQAEIIVHARDDQTRVLHINAHAQAQTARLTLWQSAGPDAMRKVGELSADPLASLDVLVDGATTLLLTASAPLSVDSIELGEVVADAR